MTMNVVVPYASLHPATEMVLSDWPNSSVCFVNVGRVEDEYRQVLQALWMHRNDVIIVEQDIVPWPGSLEELWSCMGEWCGFSYKLFGGYGVFHGLGCTKIRRSLMAKLPTLWDEPCKWDVLDQRLLFAAREIGVEPHHHRPSVIHLSEREYGKQARCAVGK